MVEYWVSDGNTPPPHEMLMDDVIYLDNAATSWPKPPEVTEAMVRYMSEAGSPGRSGHRMSLTAARAIYRAREGIASLVDVEDPLRIVFTCTATVALNIVLRGMLSPGDHVLTTSVEHNAVIRPLRMLEKQGVRLTIVPCSTEGFVDPEDIAQAVQPDTVMIVAAHASNVLGSIQPIRDIGRICRERGIPFMVDAAQSIGALPVNMEADCIDLLAFSGHKSLYGPQGTGGLVISDGFDPSRIPPLIYGGTGSNSGRDEQPSRLPDILESGTPNGPGIAGLSAGVEFILSTGVDKIREREKSLTRRMIEGLAEIPGVVTYGPQDGERRTAVVSFNIKDLDPAMVALALDERFGIMCRAGLHCAPSAHRTAGTFPQGTIRFGIGYFQTEWQIDRALDAVRTLAREDVSS